MPDPRPDDLFEIEAAAAGDLGKIEALEEFGPCPGCGAMLAVWHLPDPTRGGAMSRAMTHPVPFCRHFAEGEPEALEVEVLAARLRS